MKDADLYMAFLSGAMLATLSLLGWLNLTGGI